jgi:O-antigen/teichoic acid export membrane protein
MAPNRRIREHRLTLVPTLFRRFVSDFATYGITTILSRGIGLLLVPLYTRVLSPADYGAIDLLTVFGTLVGLTIALEVSQGVARFYGDAPTDRAKSEYASSALWFTVASYSVFAVAALAAAEPLARLILGDDGFATSFRLAVVSIWFAAIFYLAQNQLRYELRPRQYAVVSLSATLIGVAVSIILVTAAGMGINGVMTGQIVGNAVGATGGLVATRRTFRALFLRERLTELLRFSAPLVPSGIAVFVVLYIDRILIEHYLSISAVGVFGVAYRLASIVTLPVIAVQAAITPLVYQHYRNADTPRALTEIFGWFIALSLLTLLGLSLFSPEIVAIIAPADYAEAADVVPILAPGLLLANMYVFAPGLAIERRTGAIAVINIGGAVAIFALNVLLIPVLGLIGSAVADLIGAATMFTAYLVSSQRLYPVPHDWRALGVCVMATVGAIVLGTLTRVGSLIDFVVGGVLLTVILILTVKLGLIDVRAIQNHGVALATGKRRQADWLHGRRE